MSPTRQDLIAALASRIYRVVECVSACPSSIILTILSALLAAPMIAVLWGLVIEGIAS